MVNILKLLFITSLILTFSGCGQNKSWDKIIEVKSRSLGERLCSTRQGFYNSVQITQRDIRANEYISEVRVVCYNGYTYTYDIEEVEKEESVRVAELLKGIK